MAQPAPHTRFLQSPCVRLRPQCPNHVWSYDFVEDPALMMAGNIAC